MEPVNIPVWQDGDMTAVARGMKAIAFDLDNTLARSKKPMLPDMAARITELTKLVPVAVITGGSFDLARSQVLDMLGASANREHVHIMPTSGTRYYRWADGQWRCQYSLDLSDEARSAAKASIERHAKAQGVWEQDVWGERIEDRGSQITFSALGQSAPVEAKERWDPTNVKKDRLAAAVAADVPDLVVRSGGSTSIDISAKGIDKAYAVGKLCDMLGIGIDQVVFVGDRMDPDGNDYAAALAGTRPIRVSGPADTLRVCDRIISVLEDDNVRGTNGR